MAAAPHVLDVRGLFLRFILLVVVPAVGLVGFGVVAISNERAVVEQRFQQEYSGRLRTIAAELASTLDEVAGRLLSSEPSAPSELVKFEFTLGDPGLETSRALDPETTAGLAPILRANAPPLNGSIALVPVQSGPARGLYAIRAFEGSLRGFAFSEPGIARKVEELGRQLYPNEPAQFTLEGPRDSVAPSANSMRRILDELIADREQGPLSLPLPGLLSDWRIRAKLPGDDPVTKALWRNRTVYIVALAVFYLVITIGVIVTLRGIRREVRLSRLKTDFVSNISHELRTPLTSIRMFAEMLQLGRARTPEEQAECISFIARETERLSQLTERTLDWARIEAGRRAFELQPLAPRAFVESVLATFYKHSPLAQDVITTEHDADLPSVEGDSGALGQVFLNLLENAVKYTREDKRIRLRVRREKQKVLFEVEDNGIGIAPRDLKRIFERFYRSDDLLSRATEGSGLGLSIARMIVVAHGGKLTVKSRLSQGSTFTVELPVRARSVSAAAQPPGKEHAT